MDHDARIAKVAASLSDAGVDALLVTDLTNVRYLTGFSGSNGQVLVSEDDAVFFSDRRYEQRAKVLVQGASIDIYADRLSDSLKGHVSPGTRVGVEAETMTLATHGRLGEALSDATLVVTTGLVEDLRRTKEPEEVEATRAAAEISDAAFEWLLDRLVPGAKERDIALDLEVWMRAQGAEDVSFEPIVGSGELSAHIHHIPGERTLEKGDLVLVDYGAKREGYCSDTTRTFVLGPASDEQRSIYDLVLEANAAAIEAVAAGKAAAEVDSAARRLIDAAGYEDRFGHGVGHGIGLDVHEAPRLARTSDDHLRAGDVVTIEPGVYLPGSGGVRVEDCVLVTETGAEVIGRSPKDSLIEL